MVQEVYSEIGIFGTRSGPKYDGEEPALCFSFALCYDVYPASHLATFEA